MLYWIKLIRGVCGDNMKKDINEFYFLFQCNGNIGDFGNFYISKLKIKLMVI